jgi:hypothetical protein
MTSSLQGADMQGAVSHQQDGYIGNVADAPAGSESLSILRVAEHAGQMRVYFLNPNNEGRQSWGPGLEPTVAGHGERYGESSLPFYQFASRIYAFHYLKADLSDPQSIPAEKIDRVIEIARNSWGDSYTWTD